MEPEKSKPVVKPRSFRVRENIAELRVEMSRDALSLSFYPSLLVRLKSHAVRFAEEKNRDTVTEEMVRHAAMLVMRRSPRIDWEVTTNRNGGFNFKIKGLR